MDNYYNIEYNDREYNYRDYNYNSNSSYTEYSPCFAGLLVPGPPSTGLPWALIYFVSLVYCFLGLAVISDDFMCSVDKIISFSRKVYHTTTNGDKPQVIKVPFWSNTVANLTLVALSCCALEFFVPIIEVLAKNFEAGDLGPFTLIGSAAFKLSFITGICIMSICAGEIRRVKNVKVLFFTGSFLLLAYGWLYLILALISFSVIEIFETIITFLLYPILVIMAWLIERNSYGIHDKVGLNKDSEMGNIHPADKFGGKQEYFRDGQLDQVGLMTIFKEVRKHPGLTDEDAAVLAAIKLIESRSHSYTWYRVGVIRHMTGGRKIKPHMSTKLKEVYAAINKQLKTATLEGLPEVNSSKNAIVDFHAASCAVMKDTEKLMVTICRTGCTNNIARVRVESSDGTATVGKHYTEINETITFAPGEVEKHIPVMIINGSQWEPDKKFFLQLTLPLDEKELSNIQIGHISVMEIIYSNSDEPSVVMFSQPSFLVKESVEKAIIPVTRKMRPDGNISVKWRTIDRTATDGKDFKGGEGVIEFKHAEVERNIEIPIINTMAPKKNEYFEIELFDADNGANLGQIHQVAVTITDDDDFSNELSRITALTNANVDAVRIHHKSYGEKIKASLQVNGGDTKNASAVDYVMCIVTFPWKIIFSVVPPSGILGGSICFLVSLLCTGLLTAIICDLASLFGCLLSVMDSITGLIILAFLTSLPDVFAMNAAAAQEKYADNALGIVTGSSAVVFLSLGLAWMMSSIYHSVQGNMFYVYAGGLGSTLILFIIMSAICIIILVLRRIQRDFGKAELGGPTVAKGISGTLMIILWLLYIIITALESYGYILIH
ncbi:sodium/calcium exchanger Calx-like isoform X2 [Oratosquilla oratoria]|uniref:sodium/calcium exchanger Calx-like isoform X2 n=1 Tax=Oratosquilla oratoria TaxID=337810 RepID=UPI003F760508